MNREQRAQWERDNLFLTWGAVLMVIDILGWAMFAVMTGETP